MLEEKLPPVARVPRTKGYLHWNKIDAELEPKVKNAISQVEREKHPLKRIGITEIIKRVGYKNRLDKKDLQNLNEFKKKLTTQYTF